MRRLLYIGVVIGCMAFTIPCAAENHDIPVVPLSQEAVRLLETLKVLGMYNPGIHAFVNKVGARIDDGRLNLAEQEISGGKIALQYRLAGGLNAKQAELHFTSENMPHTDISITMREAKINYALRF